jgi:DNA-binding Xre family transcriptional regulator
MVKLRIREIAEEKKISMSKLSRTADVNYKTVQNIWRDPYQGVNTKTLERIVRALGVATSALLEDVPDEEV